MDHDLRQLSDLGVFPVWRLAVAAALSRAIPFRKVLFLGAPLGPLGPADEIAVLLKHRPEIGLAAMGYLGDKSGADAVPYVGGMNEFEAVFQEHAPSRIVVPREARDFPVRRLLELQRLGTRVEDLSGLYESVSGRISSIRNGAGAADLLGRSRLLPWRRSSQGHLLGSRRLPGPCSGMPSAGGGCLVN